MKRIATLIVLMSLVLVFSFPGKAQSQGLFGTYPAYDCFQPLSYYSPPLSSPSTAFMPQGPVFPEWAKMIHGRLQYKVTAKFFHASLLEATDVLRDLLRCNVILSSEARESIEEFDLSVNGMRGALVLTWICRLTKAKWVLKDEAIFIYLDTEVKKKDERMPTADEIFDLLEEMEEDGELYTPPDFIPPPFPFSD